MHGTLTSASSIDVVAALGDSITAGFGIKGLEGLFNEYRGLSGSIGFDHKAITSANFLKHYNPDLIGGAIGHHLGEMTSDHYKYHPKEDHLNAAQSGAQSKNLHYQVSYLLEQMKSNPKIDFGNSWKTVSVLIGANDGCRICRSHNVYLNITQAADQYEANVRQAIELMRHTMPRLLVNLFPMLKNMTELVKLNEEHFFCKEAHKTFLSGECTCLNMKTNTNKHLEMFDEALSEYAQRISIIQADYAQNYNNATFAVTMQPFFANILFPSFKYLSTLDCFHPSLFAHEQMAVAGWNSMFYPLKKKPVTWTQDEPLHCAKATDRIFAN